MIVVKTKEEFISAIEKDMEIIKVTNRILGEILKQKMVKTVFHNKFLKNICHNLFDKIVLYINYDFTEIVVNNYVKEFEKDINDKKITAIILRNKKITNNFSGDVL